MRTSTIMTLILLLLTGLASGQNQSDAVLLQTPLDSLESITENGGQTSLTADDFVTVDGRTGVSIPDQFDNQYIAFPAADNFNLEQGEISLWYRPNYDAAANDDTGHHLVTLGDVYNVPRIELLESDRLAFGFTDDDWTLYATSAPYHGDLWQAGEWVHIRATWDVNNTEDALALYVNDQRVDEGFAEGGWTVRNPGDYGTLFVGTGNRSGHFPADGIIADLTISGQRITGDDTVLEQPPEVEQEAEQLGNIEEVEMELSFDFEVIDDQFRHGQGLTVVDIDDDADADVLLASSLNDAVYLYENTGGDWRRVNVAPENSLVAMMTDTADFDLDGNLDVAAVGLFDRACTFCSPGTVAWYENNGEEWVTHIITPDLWGARYVVAAQMDGDERPDLVVSAIEIDGNGNGLYWFRNVTDGWEGPLDIDTDLLNVETILAHDVDGDGAQDVIAAGRNSDRVMWYANTDDGFTAHTLAEVTAPYGLALADINADGTRDVVVTGDAGVVWYTPGEDVTAHWQENVIDPDFGMNGMPRVTAVDLNDDGLVDLAVTMNNRDTGQAEFRWYRNNGDGSWGVQTIESGIFGLVDVAGGDFNGDGLIDLVASTYNNTGTNDQLPLWLNAP